jgi:DNA-binding CsgD family transcriptional regulator
VTLKPPFKLLMLILLWVNISIAQRIPPVSKFSPDIYGADNQNWSITQAKDQTMFFANSKGLLKYDGETWELLGSINNTILRSVYAIGDDIYTGAYMEFGVWKKENSGQYFYHSLSESLDLIEDEQFWNITSLNDYVVFQSLDAIYLYSLESQEYQIINGKSEFTKIVVLDNILYFHKKNEGLFKLINGIEEPVNTSSIFKKSILINMYSIDNRIYAQTQFNGVINIEDNMLFKPVNSLNLFETTSVYNSLQLQNGDIYLGTISKGLIKISSNEVKLTLNQINAISNNTILSLFQDNQNDIWLGLDNGINKVNFDSQVTIFNDNDGSLGTIYDTIEFENILYLGTNQGLFYFNSKNNKYELIEGTKGQVWKLFRHQNTLFCGHHNGTYTINSNKASLVEGVQGTWMFRPIDENTIISGNYDGLHVYAKGETSWKHARKIIGFDISTKYFEFIDSTHVLVNHEYKGIYKLSLDEKITEVITLAKDTSVEKGLFSSIIKLDNNIFYAYKNGIYKYDKEQSAFVKDSVLSHFYDNSYTSGRLVKTRDNKIWVFTKTDIGYFSMGSTKNEYIIKKFPISAESRNQISGYENISLIEQNTFLIGKNNGYIKINKIEELSVNPSIFINRITISNNEEGKSLLQSPNEKGNLDHKFNDIQFSVSDYNHSSIFKTEYQYKLLGYKDDWSIWNENNTITFSNLPHGNYKFVVRSRIGQDNYSDTKYYEFSIAKPFYLSNMMWVVYILSLILVSIAIHTSYKQYYKHKKIELQRIADRKLEIKDLESQRQIMKITNDKLRLDVENKNRELAISTMSIIKKNEFLSKIKSDLKPFKSNDKLVRRVINTIDRNLNNNDDWEFFEEAFNNADKDFFKKLKNSHSGLTPNELKLCAYLRLNLTSKEIAPLFNISPKSVEIKRYRLRKKMDLERNQSLTNYILSI